MDSTAQERLQLLNSDCRDISGRKPQRFTVPFYIVTTMLNCAKLTLSTSHSLTPIGNGPFSEPMSTIGLAPCSRPISSSYSIARS